MYGRSVPCCWPPPRPPNTLPDPPPACPDMFDASEATPGTDMPCCAIICLLEEIRVDRVGHVRVRRHGDPQVPPRLAGLYVTPGRRRRRDRPERGHPERARHCHVSVRDGEEVRPVYP